MSSSVDGPPGAGCSDTLAMRCTGTCAGESANAQPLDRDTPSASAFWRAMRRSSW
jgi:hypothetical protein